MVRIDGYQEMKAQNLEGVKDEVSAQEAEASKASEKLQKTFSGYGEADAVKKEDNKPPKLDYTVFAKSVREAAATKARDAINEVKDLARQFNADFPNKSYSPRYADFPKPENYDKKNYGNKERAYQAWKDDVDAWKEDEKQDLATLRSNNINNLQEQNLAGLKALYCRLGLTEEFIAATFKELEGDIQSVKAKLDKAVKDINANTNRVGNKVISNDNRNTRGVHDHIIAAEGGIHAHIDYSEHKIRETVINEGEYTRDVVAKKAKQTQDVVITTAGETQGIVKEEAKDIKQQILKKLDKMPTKKSLVIDFIKGTLHLPIDVAAAGLNLTALVMGLPVEAAKKLAEFLKGI